MTKDDTFIVFEVFERRVGGGVVSHGLFGNLYRANLKRKKLRAAGIPNTVAVRREVE